jgi:putative Holliday junction resolvase
MRALGLDLGAKRIGVAISDSAETVATPIEVLQRTRDVAALHRSIRSLVREWEAEIVVVGMPYSLDGSMGPAAAGVAAEVEQLRATIGVPVETYDERLTTVSAQRSIREMQLDPAGRRAVVDKIAAAVMLQQWLDHRRHTLPPTS